MTELPKRGRNRLKAYDYRAPGAYFVTICVREHRNLLGKVVVGADAHIGPRVVLSEYGAVVEGYVKTIPGVVDYVIMPNHLHLYLEIPIAEHGPMPTSARISKRPPSGGLFDCYSSGAKAFISMPASFHQKPGWAAFWGVMRVLCLRASWKSRSMAAMAGVSSRNAPHSKWWERLR